MNAAWPVHPGALVWLTRSCFPGRPLSLADIGNNEALAQMPVGGGGLGADVRMNGSAVFVAWRAVYFSKLLSYRNRMMVMLDWVKTKTFGRDTSRS